MVFKVSFNPLKFYDSMTSCWKLLQRFWRTAGGSGPPGRSVSAERSTIQCPLTFLAFVPLINFICSWALAFLISALWVWTPVLQLCGLPMFLLFAISPFEFQFLKKLLAKAIKAKFLFKSLVFLHNRVADYEISVLFKNQPVFLCTFCLLAVFQGFCLSVP